MKNKTRGFTLIELLVVIAIVGVLLALIAPAIANTRETAQMAACMNNIKQITMAAFMYADDHNSAIPEVSDTVNYTENAENVYRCPRDTRQAVGIAKPSYTAWQYTPKSLLPEDAPVRLSELIIYLESDKAGIYSKDEIEGEDVAYRHGNRTVVVFGDGHTMTGNKDQVSVFLGTGVDDPAEGGREE